MPCLPVPWGKRHSTHRIGGWVGPRAALDVVVKRKIPSPHQQLNSKSETLFIA